MASPRDIADVAGATACNAWILDFVSYGETDTLVKVLTTARDVEQVKSDLTGLQGVRSVSEIPSGQLDQAPAADPGFQTLSRSCT